MSLRDQLLSVRRDFGTLTPKNVVLAATPEDSPLHHRFEWDDQIAGTRFREIQAADLIREVRVTYATKGGGEQSVRAFVVQRDGSPSSEYLPVEDVVADPFKKKLLLQEFEREWRAFKARYDHLVEFAEIIRQDVAA